MTAATATTRSVTPTTPDPDIMSPAAIALRERTTERRARHLAAILKKVRRLLDPNEMRGMDDFETWSAFALLFAVVPEEPWHAKEIHQQLQVRLVKNLAKNGCLPVIHARVLELVDGLAWVADRNHEPDSWPPVCRLGED